MEECKHKGESRDDNMRVEIEGTTMFIVYHESTWGDAYEEEESSMSIEVNFCPFCGKKLEESA